MFDYRRAGRGARARVVGTAAASADNSAAWGGVEGGVSADRIGISEVSGHQQHDASRRARLHRLRALFIRWLPSPSWWRRLRGTSPSLALALALTFATSSMTSVSSGPGQTYNQQPFPVEAPALVKTSSRSDGAMASVRAGVQEGSARMQAGTGLEAGAGAKIFPEAAIGVQCVRVGGGLGESALGVSGVVAAKSQRCSFPNHA